MMGERHHGLERLVAAAQCGLVTLALWTCLAFSHHAPWTPHLRFQAFLYNLALVLGVIAVPDRQLPSRTARRPALSRHSCRQLTVTLLAVLIFLGSNRPDSLPRGPLGLSFILAVLVLIGGDHALPRWVGRWAFRGLDRWPLILVGSKRRALASAHWLARRDCLGLVVRGIVTDDPPGNDPVPVLGATKDLARLVSGTDAVTLVLVDYPLPTGAFARYARFCEERGLRLVVLHDLAASGLRHQRAVYHADGHLVLEMRREPLEDPVNRLLKRGLDLGLSALGLGMTLVVWLAAGLIQRRQSPGPVLFRQVREGFLRRPFCLYKLRSMHVGDPADQRRPTSPQDPRLYPFGAFLRRTGLDELPQYWNVLRGDMSLVGPRPHLPTYAAAYHRRVPRSFVRALVKPGLTGPAQLSGSHDGTESEQLIVRRMRLDLAYLEHWSLAQDLRWLVLTAGRLVRPQLADPGWGPSAARPAGETVRRVA